MLILLGLVGAVAGGKALFDRFQQGGFACLPSDFPRYPGATVSSESTYTGTNGSECRMAFDTGDPVSWVGPYYQTWLDSGDWSVVSVDYDTGTITFHRRSRPQAAGTAKLTRLGQGTRISVVLKTYRRRSATSVAIMLTNESSGMSTCVLVRSFTLTCPEGASVSPTTAM